MGTEATPAQTKPRTVKIGDKVHVICHQHTPARRFDKVHLEARVEKVHPAGFDGDAPGKFVDVVIPHASGDPKKSIRITESPRDDGGTQADSWHFPEDAKE